MKIGIIAFSNIEYLPYLSRYENILLKQKIDYDIIYWQRKQISNVPLEKKYKGFINNSDLNKPKILKIYDFLNFRKFVISQIKDNKYDKLIILSTIPGVLIFDKLFTSYKNKYILDIRDPSYEKNFLFRFLLGQIINYSVFSPISSKGFLSFLPGNKNKFVLIHNYLPEDNIKDNSDNLFRNDVNKIIIRFLGFLRHYEANTALIEALSNDTRFELHYHGVIDSKDGLKLQKEVKLKNSHNIFFHGFYDREAKKEIMQKTHIIHNIYNNDSTKFAMGNKLYDGANFYLPQILTQGSIMGEYADEYGLGLSLNIESISSDEIYIWYKNLNLDKFNKNCDLFLQDIKEEEEEFNVRFFSFINSEKKEGVFKC